MWPFGVVFPPPAFDVELGVGEGDKPVGIEALVAHAAVEALDEAVLYRLAGLDEAEVDAAVSGPRIEGATAEFTPVVQRLDCRLAALRDHRVERTNHGLAGQ